MIEAVRESFTKGQQDDLERWLAKGESKALLLKQARSKEKELQVQALNEALKSHTVGCANYLSVAEATMAKADDYATFIRIFEELCSLPEFYNVKLI